MSKTARRLRLSYPSGLTRQTGRLLARTGSRRRLAIIVTALALLGSSVGANAAPFERLATDKRSRQEAIDTIPFDRLSETAQGKLWGVVSRPSLYRQMPVTVVESDPDMYLFLVRHPEVIVNMWQLMGVTKVEVDRTGEYTFGAKDGAGTECDVELVYGDPHTHVYYAEGAYEGSLLRQLIRGRCVLVLRSEFSRTEDQHVFATSTLDMFVQFDNVGAEILAKTLHPLVGKSADHNFIESTRFLGQVSQAAATRANGVKQLAGRLNNIQPDVRDKFLEVAAIASRRATLRAAGHVIWGDEERATTVSAAPIVMPDAAMRAAHASLQHPIRKRLQLRR